MLQSRRHSFVERPFIMRTIFCCIISCLITNPLASRAQQSAPPAQVGAQQLPSVELENWTSPQPGWVYVLDPRPNVGETGGHIWLVDPESGQVMGGIHTGYHPDFALSPDGTHL